LANNTSLLQLQERVSRLEGGSELEKKREKEKGKSSLNIQKPIHTIKQELTSKKEATEHIQEDNSSPVQPFSHSAKEPIIEKVQVKQADDDLEPMPISKPIAKGDDANLNSLWIELLRNIQSPPTAALLSQHAKPVTISEEKIEIICKENFFKMLTNESKKASIEEGAKKLFNKYVSVIIKSASTDEFGQGEKKNSINDVKMPRGKDAKKVEEKVLQNPSSPNKEEEISDEDDFADHELAKSASAKRAEAYAPSDQVTMVMKLFDGKYID